MKPLGHNPNFGNRYKKCCFSKEYWLEYYKYQLPGPSNHPDLKDNNWYITLATNPNWAIIYTDEAGAEDYAHPTTSGTMRYRHSGFPGWICLDPDCFYYTTVNPGAWFFEC